MLFRSITVPDQDLIEYFQNNSGAIYGAGGRFRDFIEQGGYADMGMNICAAFDSSPQGHGSVVSGIPVYTYSKLETKEIDELNFNYFLIASTFYSSILKDIQHWTLRGKKIFLLNDKLKIEPDPLPRQGTWQKLT